MVHSPLRILLLSTILLALGPASASAATPAQIHRDAADGSIDGSYSLAEMRAADRDVSAEQREYFGWEDVYRDHVRSLVPPPIPALRPGRDVAPSSRSSSTADKLPSKAARSSIDRAPHAVSGARATSSSAFHHDVTAGDDQVTTAAPANDRTRGASAADSDVPLAWIIATVPATIIAAGVWRMRRVRVRRQATEAGLSR